MGQAKQRGTYEQRVASAKERNRQIEQRMIERPNSPITTFAKRHGVQRMATKLAMFGLLAHSPTIR